MTLMLNFFKKIDQIIEFLSKGLLVVVVLGMLFLSVTSIFLRWMETSYAWMEPLIRHLVFSSAFLGGVIATGKNNHIGIDILAKFFEGTKNIKALRWLKVVTSLAACLVLIWLSIASWGFVKLELEFGRTVFWGIESGYLTAIIPTGLVLIAYRFFYKFIHYLILGIPAGELGDLPQSVPIDIEEVSELQGKVMEKN